MNIQKQNGDYLKEKFSKIIPVQVFEIKEKM